MRVYYFKIYLWREVNVKKAVSGGGPLRAKRDEGTRGARRGAPAATRFHAARGRGFDVS